MFYEYASQKCDELEALQARLVGMTGFNYNPEDDTYYDENSDQDSLTDDSDEFSDDDRDQYSDSSSSEMEVEADSVHL